MNDRGKRKESIFKKSNIKEHYHYDYILKLKKICFLCNHLFFFIKHRL